jgi:type I restriction enzyme S subunit
MKFTKVRLGAICQEIYRYPTYYDIEYIDEGIPEIRGELITSDGNINLNREKWRFISEKTSSKFSRTVLLENDLVMSVRGTIGKIGLIPKELVGANMTANLIRISPNRLKVNERYLWIYMRSTEFINFLNSASSSTTIKTIKAPDLKDILIPLPPIAEQKRIAEILDRTQSLISKRKEAITQLDTLTQSIFLEMFGDPVTNPKGLEIKKFKDIGTLDRGVSKHRPRNAPELLGGIYPLIQTGDIANCGGYIRQYQSTYSETGLRQSKMWRSGTLCITVAANIAKTGILTFDACFPDSVVGFLSEDLATIEFVRVWLSFLQKTLEETAPESAQKNINLAILRDLNVPFPPLPLQKEFAQRVEAVEKLKATHHASLSQLEALFTSLQHRAFRGEL